MTEHLTRRAFLKSAALGAAAATVPVARLLAAADAAGGPRPNIIFILADDLGWGDPHLFGGHPYIKTPNLDRLAREGTCFTQSYTSSPVCSPSRCGFMTSHYPARHKIHGHFADHAQNQQRGMPNWLDPRAATLPGLLKKAGYRTGHFGKWHLGHGEGAPPPTEYGIDVSKTVNSTGPQLGSEKTQEFFRARSTGMMVDETIKFIEAGRNSGKPFYVNLWTLVPHALLKPTPEELAVYKDLDPDPKDFPAYMRQYAGSSKNFKSQMKVYAAAVTGMDKALGRLFDWLDKEGLADNTLIFFTSDNGPEDYRVSNAANAGMGSPGPHRARKRSLYEGGLRTSCIARWKGHVPAGKVDKDSVLTAVDFLPTMCSLAGAAVPESVKADGENVSDILIGKSRPRTRPIFWEWRFGVAGNKNYHPPKLAVRDGKWKLFVNPDGSNAELYDIPADGEERRNVAADHKEVVARLKTLVLEWKKTLP
ncbi:MAG: sulfatase-like hydrolase/transferase [Planctomycetaceae bacterium]|nr:sulfatase-like hydrolase/transferase [Planctomycetaceae bacterium]